MSPRKDSRWSHAVWWEQNIDVPGNGICLPYTLSQSQRHKQEVFLSPTQVKYFTPIYAGVLRTSVSKTKIPRVTVLSEATGYPRSQPEK